MLEENLNTSWFVVQTRSRFEKKSHDLLLKSGLMVYLPLQKRMKVWSDRMKEVEEPLFSGYLFVQFNESQRYQVLNTQGIVRFVSFGGKYATISNTQLQAVKNALLSDLEIDIVDTFYEKGQEVLITSGPFKDNRASVVRTNSGKGKLLLTLEAIGKGILLEIKQSRVEALPQQYAIA